MTLLAEMSVAQALRHPDVPEEARAFIRAEIWTLAALAPAIDRLGWSLEPLVWMHPDFRAMRNGAHELRDAILRFVAGCPGEAA